MSKTEVPTQQFLHRIEIDKLKSLIDLDIYFDNSTGNSADRKYVTAILGVNGHGKSTILHALASCFKPVTPGGEDYRFNNFFPSYKNQKWPEMQLTLTHSYRIGLKEVNRKEEPLRRSTTRWPIANRRPARDVTYFGIDDCIPLIEFEKKKTPSLKDWESSSSPDKIHDEVLKFASSCLNRKYESYLVYKNKKKGGKPAVGVKYNDTSYSALTMSAGEQKVFLLLEKILNTEKNSLILIDELDLLLHEKAFREIVRFLIQQSQKKRSQVIFTTHRESIIEFENEINIRHIVKMDQKTECFYETKPELIERLTGNKEYSIEIFAEDQLAKEICKHVAKKLGISKYVKIVTVGAGTNIFTTVCGLILKNDGDNDLLNSLFLLDGDIYRTREEKEKQIQKHLTGDTENAKRLRKKIMESDNLVQLGLPQGVKPETYIHSLLIEMEPMNSEQEEIIKIAKRIESTEDSHGYINDIALEIEPDEKDKDRAIGYIIDVVSHSQKWEEYTEDLRVWLENRKKTLRLG